VVSEELLPVIEQAVRMLSQPPKILALGDRPGVFAEHEARKTGTVPGLPSPDDGALLIYTSGTTGKPKGVLLTQANVMAGLDAVSRAFEMKPADRSYCVMPLFHTNGLMFSTLPYLLVGATVILKKRFSASGFWPQIHETRANIASVSPTILAMLLEHEATAPAAADIKLDFIKVASAPTPVELAERFEARFGRGCCSRPSGSPRPPRST
jgi:long-chain acyl-CoA synthetase